MFGFEEVFQNRVLSLLFLRPPRHRVTCDLIPLAVLKPDLIRRIEESKFIVTCDLIPLAVLKRIQDGASRADGLVSHVISYRLRY